MTSLSWRKPPNATSRSSVSEVATSARGIRSISAARRDAGGCDEAPSAHGDCQGRADGDDDRAVVHAVARAGGAAIRESAAARRAHRFAASRRVPVLEGRAPVHRLQLGERQLHRRYPDRAQPADRHSRFVGDHDRAVPDRRPHRSRRHAPAVQRPERVDAGGGAAGHPARDAGDPFVAARSRQQRGGPARTLRARIQ